MVWLSSLGDVEMVWFNNSGDVKMVRFGDSRDVKMAGKPLQPGTRWKEGPWASGLGKMVVMEEKVEEDSLVPAAVRTMSELRKMADTIHPMIQLEEDHRFNHHDRKLPILDIKVWVIELEEEEQKRALAILQKTNVQLASHPCKLSHGDVHQENLPDTIRTPDLEKHLTGAELGPKG